MSLTCEFWIERQSKLTVSDNRHVSDISGMVHETTDLEEGIVSIDCGWGGAQKSWWQYLHTSSTVKLCARINVSKNVQRAI